VILVNRSVVMLIYTMRHGHPLAVLFLPRELRSVKGFVLGTLWFTLYISSLMTAVDDMCPAFKTYLEASAVPAVF